MTTHFNNTSSVFIGDKTTEYTTWSKLVDSLNPTRKALRIVADIEPRWLYFNNEDSNNPWVETHYEWNYNLLVKLLDDTKNGWSTNGFHMVPTIWGSNVGAVTVPTFERFNLFNLFNHPKWRLRNQTTMASNHSWRIEVVEGLNPDAI